MIETETNQINSLSFEEEIVKRVHVHVNRRRSARHERGPLPSIVLGVEQEIRADDRDTNGDDDEDQEDQQHEAVDVVNLVSPERCENEVPESDQN